MRSLPLETEIITRRPALIQALEDALGTEAVISDDTSLKPYESDGLTAYRQTPLAAILPADADQVSTALRICHEFGVKIVPRGAGTSLSGGALPLADGVLLGLSRLNRIKDIDYENGCVTAEPGVTNLAISHAVAERGFYYAPDPSSQIACTIGGNVAENAGGVHCLKYGLTTNNILGLELALVDGARLTIGGKHLDQGGYDIMGLITGSEGLLGIVTEVTVRILPRPETARAILLGFAGAADAGRCVAAIIAAGIVPAGMELMDRLAIDAAEAYCSPGYPADADAILIIEVDGLAAEVDRFIATISDIATSCSATSVRASTSDDERLAIWAGRKAAFPAVGRIAPDYYCMDGTIPRHRLAETLSRITDMSRQYGLPVANVFHAGDGNLHPLVLYDANRSGDLEKAEAFGADILKLCVEFGGVLTGEHGVGVEKRDLMPLMFSEQDLAHQERVKCAFDPTHRMNPGKMFPELHRCAELGRVHVHGGKLRLPHIPRL